MNRVILRIGAIATLIAVLAPPCRYSYKSYGYGSTATVISGISREFLLEAGDIAVPQYLAQVLAVAFAFTVLAWAFARRKRPTE